MAKRTRTQIIRDLEQARELALQYERELQAFDRKKRRGARSKR